MCMYILHVSSVVFYSVVLNKKCLFFSGSGTDRQGGHRHLHLTGGRHHGDASERGEADGEGKGQREGRERTGSHTQKLTHFASETPVFVKNEHSPL